MLPEELQYVFVLLGRLDVADGEQTLEVGQFRPNLVTAQTGSLMELVSCRH